MDFSWLGWVLIAVSPFAAVKLAMMAFDLWTRSVQHEKERLEDESRETEYGNWYEGVLARGGIRPVFCPLPLSDGELCYSFDNAVSLYLPSDPHEHHGDGVMFDTEPGQPVGGGWSILDCFHRVRFAGRGRLCVTDKCISFGDFGRRQEISLDDVHTVAASRSCLLIGTEEMDRPLLFQNVNGQRLRDVIHFVLEGAGGDGD